MTKKLRLFSIAESQNGYFTSRQAVACGFARPNFHLKLKSGEWVQEWRGIYRLGQYPIVTRPELTFWSLWSCDQKGKSQGIWSYETALDFHNLCDVMPAKLHLSVPSTFRKRLPPHSPLQLHTCNPVAIETETHSGYRVTTPFRTLFDLASENSLSPGLLHQAIETAAARGLISNNQASKLNNLLVYGSAISNLPRLSKEPRSPTSETRAHNKSRPPKSSQKSRV